MWKLDIRQDLNIINAVAMIGHEYLQNTQSLQNGGFFWLRQDCLFSFWKYQARYLIIPAVV